MDDHEGNRVVKEYHHGSPEAEQLSEGELEYEMEAKRIRAEREPRLIQKKVRRNWQQRYTLFREKDKPKTELSPASKRDLYRVNSERDASMSPNNDPWQRLPLPYGRKAKKEGHLDVRFKGFYPMPEYRRAKGVKWVDGLYFGQWKTDRPSRPT